MPASTKEPAWLSHARALRHSPALVLWSLFLALTPIYVFKSGLPQPGDLLVFLLVPVTLFSWNGRLDKSATYVIRPLLLLLLWLCLVNLAWATIRGKFSPKDYLIFPLFYFFNIAVFVCASIMSRANAERFLRLTVDVVFATVIFQVIASFVISTQLYRGQVFFNNPNQLGFYALLSASLIAVCQRRLNLSKLKCGIAVSGCAYLALLSASRAAVAGIMLLMAVLMFSSPRTIILVFLASVGMLTVGGPVKTALDRSQARTVEERSGNKSFSEVRGYDRMWKYPEYLVVGAGEGDLERFAEPGERGHELHSSFGTLLFGYGIVGISLFAWFVFRLVRGAPLREAMMLLPVLIFTVAHNGLRFTSFWVLLTVFAVMKQVPLPARRARAAAQPALARSGAR